MIDIESIQKLPEGTREAVASAFLTIYQSGVIAIQQSTNFAGILHGAADEEPQVLAERIIKFRQSQYAIDSLLGLIQQLNGADNG